MADHRPGRHNVCPGTDVEREPKAVLLSQKSDIKQAAADYSEGVNKFEGVPNISAAANQMLAAQRMERIPRTITAVSGRISSV